MSHSPSHTGGGREQTIREVLDIGFPRVHSSEEALASTTTRNLGAPLSPTPVGLRSKRGLHRIEADEDQSGHPLYRELVGWQGPMPGYFTMHLPDRARLKSVKASDNLPLFLVEYIQRFPGLALPIPHRNGFASRKRTEAVLRREGPTDERRLVETIADLQSVHLYRGQLIAACASAVAGNPKRFTDTSDFLQSTRTAPTIHPGSEEVSASRYLSLNPELPGLRKSTRQAHQVRYDALELFRLSAIQATHIQPICAPLNADFPLSAVVQFAQEQLPLESFICQGHDDPARCRSDHCCGRVLEFPRPFTTSGRPIGIDSDLVLPLMNQAQVTRLPYRRPLNRAEMVTVSLFLHNVWGVALAADATFITVSGVNEEILFIRHRATQTLLLSNVLTVHRDPLLTNTPHLFVHVGEAVCAHDDALSRATSLELHRRAGTLPASFRYPFQNEVDLLRSDLSFSELSLSYELSIGKFLPADLFEKPEYTYTSNKKLLNRATALRVHWDDDDAYMLHFILDDFKSPMTLPAVRASSSSTASVIDVKIHCFKQHSRRVFLCHFIDANKKPYGRPLVMKLAWAPILEETEEVLDFSRIVETPEIDSEFEILRQLADSHPDVACRVPKPYERFAGDIKIVEQPYKFSASFVEDCEGCYPIGIADDIDSDFLISIDTWLGSVHDREHLLHQSLSVENILFKPSDPTCFYVVGWQKALHMIGNMTERERYEREQQEKKSLKNLFVKKRRGFPSPEKRGRHDGSDEGEDEDEGQAEDEGNQYESFHGEDDA